MSSVFSIIVGIGKSITNPSKPTVLDSHGIPVDVANLQSTLTTQRVEKHLKLTRDAKTGKQTVRMAPTPPTDVRAPKMRRTRIKTTQAGSTSGVIIGKDKIETVHVEGENNSVRMEGTANSADVGERKVRIVQSESLKVETKVQQVDVALPGGAIVVSPTFKMVFLTVAGLTLIAGLAQAGIAFAAHDLNPNQQAVFDVLGKILILGIGAIFGLLGSKMT